MSQRADDPFAQFEAGVDKAQIGQKKKELEDEFKKYLARGAQLQLPVEVQKQVGDAEIAMKSLLASLRDENQKKVNYRNSMSNAQHQRSVAYDPGRVGASN